MVLHIALKDLKIIAKDIKALISLLLMPVFIMLILGTALGAIFEEDNGISKFPISVVDKDKGFDSQLFVGIIRDYYGSIFELEEDTEEAAMKKLRSNKVAAIILIHENYTVNLSNNREVKVDVLSNNEEALKGTFTFGTANGYMNILSISRKGYHAFMETATASGNKDFIERGLNGNIMMKIATRLSEELIEFKESTQKETKPISSLQYYSVAMLVMYILFSSVTGVTLMLQEKENRTLGRIIGAGVSKFELILGKCIGLATIGALQSIILVIFTTVFYRVDWGGPLYALIILSLCLVFFSSGFGMFIAAIGKNVKAANNLGEVLIMIFTALGGGMMPFYLFPDFMKTISSITPNRHAMDAYYKLMQGTDFYAIAPNCIILFAAGLLFLIIGISKFETV
ncbi:ABC-2 type transport system permease protein [Anaerobacterium chartisolvens]|uniref:ABC-2 type transport system permease protein n=1 Tax=Anaerobacterium chartisolvens TaxID=1297424 RepID=A0A369B9E2_9FIRM|nr:ABC transporter permease [Anaerobacterium chartisolvens]RCX16294.1 ABC-2 type transport system permease protein [Anaerobacterium chartisolvens]